MVDGQFYTLELLDPAGTPTGLTFNFDRVTTVIKDVTAASGGGMSYWGFGLGVAAQADVEYKSDEWLGLYEAAKKTPLAPNYMRDSKGDQGTRAHAVLEDLANGNPETDVRAKYEDGWDGYCEGAAAFWNDVYNPVNEYHAEQKFVSFRLRVAGTTDLVMYEPAMNHRSLFDLKTHKPASSPGPAYDEELLQLDAYAGMHEEMGLGHVDECFIVLATEDGKYVVDDRQVRRGAFENVVALYRDLKGAA